METNVDEWIDNLSATLFATNTNTVYRIWGAPQTRVGQVPSNSLQNQGQPFLLCAMLEVWAVRIRKLWQLEGGRISHGTTSRYGFVGGFLYDRGGR